MTITSTPPTAQISHVLPADKLLSHHPAALLFDLAILNRSLNTVTMEFRLRDSISSNNGDIRGVLGCVVDCAARLAAQPAMGACALLEQELHIRAQGPATALQVTARIESAAPRYAIYQCAIYALQTQNIVLVADSQGTLLKQSPASADPTKTGGLNQTV